VPSDPIPLPPRPNALYTGAAICAQQTGEAPDLYLHAGRLAEHAFLILAEFKAAKETDKAEALERVLRLCRWGPYADE